MAVQGPLENRGAVDGGARVAPTLDRSAIATFREIGSLEFTLSVIDQYVAEVADAVDAIKDAVYRQDASARKALAHSLKGSSLTVGAHQLAALCAALERQPEGATCPSMLVALDEELVLVCAALADERRDVLESTASGPTGSSGSGR